MFDSLLFTIMLVVFLGVLSQWLSWRIKLPAIVVMSVAGIIVGPVLGIIDPSQEFGDLYGPIISMAVAIILFEGSLQLDFREIRDLGKPVTRIVTVGAFIAWILGSLAAHYVAGLSLPVAFVIGGLFIVTGPTVILPLLRQAKLKPRPSKILKWEGIIVDPIGVLLALFAFQIILFFMDETVSLGSLLIFFAAAGFATLLGWGCGRGMGWMFEKGYIPEYLKSPVLFSVVLLCFTLADEVMHETGLLSVTAMGITMANMHIASIGNMRHFKENISVLLISTIFIMLTASLHIETFYEILNPAIIGYVLLMLFVVRPLSIWLSTIGTDLSLQEKALVGWIAPRGIVALTVSGYFASVLTDTGFEDAQLLTALTFALVFATVCAHGFSIGWAARRLKLANDQGPGVIVVGGNSFTNALVATLTEMKVPAVLVDSSWRKVAAARQSGLPTFHGEVLSEQTEYQLDMTPYESIIMASESDAYNSLVCSSFTPTFGIKHLYQTAPDIARDADLEGLTHSVGGRILFNNETPLQALIQRVDAGQVFRKTLLTKQFSAKEFMNEINEEDILVGLLKASGRFDPIATDSEFSLEPGDTVIRLSSALKEKEKIKQSKE
ncbi:sodium:proton exchanger [Jeotgalibacillus proteolyticus]|uniref:Sodium:proton exchanger n=1 Tax=Jeotgalibacillus proteolyticus TaxID=2082395 RepID=A0A2S5GAL0_9BACL|nr:sodium:proton antiporter [Jeotgalibacillus proteolyticus]PPA69951.1 sodium:proton exchanger [Jeotgalibacillus proteolyticus]